MCFWKIEYKKHERKRTAVHRLSAALRFNILRRGIPEEYIHNPRSKTLNAPNFLDLLSDLERASGCIREAIIKNVQDGDYYYNFYCKSESDCNEIKDAFNEMSFAYDEEQKIIRVKIPLTLRRNLNDSWFLYCNLNRLICAYRDKFSAIQMEPPILILLRRHSKYYTTLVCDNDNYETHRATNLICKALGFSDAAYRCHFMNQFVYDEENYLEIIVSEIKNIKNKPEILFPDALSNERITPNSRK